MSVIDCLGALAAVFPPGVQDLWERELPLLLESLPARGDQGDGENLVAPNPRGTKPYARNPKP